MSSELRLVTVLFADVVGSTAMGEELDPEEMRLLLGRFYDIARDVVADHGGALEKFIGDAAMAIFGAPRAHDDDAVRALAAALQLRDRLRTDPELGERMPIRIGVNTGEVIAAAGRTDPTGRDFIITGDPVNVAARLQQAAQPWEVLVGERSVQAARDAFRFGPPIEVAAKGKREPVRARALLAPGAVRRPRPALVGRGTELAQLEVSAHRAFDEGRPFLVTLVAPPGTGKTRLVEAFVDRLPALQPGARVATARCLPYGERLTYWPLRSLLADLVGAPSETVPELATIAGWLKQTACPDPTGTAALIAATVGMADIENPDVGALHDAWRRAIAAAGRDPLVLVFEDLHWASDSFLALVEFIMQPKASARVLTIALARPELLDRRPAWGAGRLNALTASLEPLPSADMRRLVVQLLDGGNARVVAAIVERAEGNPFFAGEMVRSVVEHAEEGRDDAAALLALTGLPDTVQATVLSRLDLLDPADRRLLQIAAVLGREFASEEVAALADAISPMAVSEGLARSVDRELLEPVGGERLAFRHVLIRDGAYQTLPRGERARLHAAAAAALERTAGRRDDAAELIAYHYREAALVPTRLIAEPGAGADLRAKAVEWLGRAAQAAMRVAASVEAAAHLRAALELSDPEQQVDLWEALGDVHLDERSAADAYGRALELAAAQGLPADRRLQLIAQLLLVISRSVGGTLAGSSEQIPHLVEQGNALLPHTDDRMAVARYRIALGFVPFSVQHGVAAPPEAIAMAQREAAAGLAAAEQLGDPNLLSTAFDALSAVAVTQRRWSEALDLASRRIELADRLAPIEVVDAYATAAWAATALGRIRHAEEITGRGSARIQPGQAPTYVLHLITWRICALALLGRWDEAAEAGDRALEIWERIGHGPAHFAGRGFLAAFDVAQGRRDQRRQELLRAAVDAIWADEPNVLRASRATMDGDVAGMHRLLADADDGETGGPDVAAATAWHAESYERVLGLCSDLHQLPGEALLTEIHRVARGSDLALVALQATRALALRRGDAHELAAVVDHAASEGLVPLAARARCDLGELSGDEAALAEGMHALEMLGDITHLDRVRARHGTRA